MKILALYLLSIATLADFSGKWTGEGSYYTARSKGECTEIFFQFKQTEKKLKILTGGYICGMLQAEYPPSSFDIVEGTLIYDGEVVGSITDDQFTIEYLGGVYKLNVKKEEDHLQYEEIWNEGDDLLVVQSSRLSIL